LASGFLRGGTGGFLKGSAAGEMIKGSGNVNRDIRVGVTHVSLRGLLSLIVSTMVCLAWTLLAPYRPRSYRVELRRVFYF